MADDLRGGTRSPELGFRGNWLEPDRQEETYRRVGVRACRSVKSASEYEERFGALVFGRIGVFTLMTFDQKSRNLFWSIFAQTVSVLVRKSWILFG